MTSRPSTAAPILAVLAIVLVTLGVYVAGYFVLSHCKDSPTQRERTFPRFWIALVYLPVSVVEQACIGRSVGLSGPW